MTAAAIDTARTFILNATEDELRQLDDLIRARLKRLRDEHRGDAFDLLRVGDRVRIASTVKPRYLAGAEATVREKRRTRVVIDLDIPQGRFHTGVVAPPEMLELDT